MEYILTGDNLDLFFSNAQPWVFRSCFSLVLHWNFQAKEVHKSWQSMDLHISMECFFQSLVFRQIPTPDLQRL